MSADELFVLALVIGSVVAVVAMAVHSRRAGTSGATAAATAKDDGRPEEPAALTVGASSVPSLHRHPHD
jgi:hypothetical protein